MKNLIKLLGLFILIMTTFFYTDKVINVIKEEDPIMKNIKDNMHLYEQKPVNAKISENTIIPGTSGREVNTEKSYKKMKEIGVYDDAYLIFNKIPPEISLKDNQDKFIIGSNKKEYVSIIYIVSDNTYLDKLKEKDIPINFFIDYNYLINNTSDIKKISNHEFYNYGDNGKYTSDNILYANNLISRIKENNAIYCLTTTYSNDTINTCQKNNFYTIVPNIICNNNCFNNIKTNLEGGSMILISDNNIKELENIITYIKTKKYEIIGLNKLLEE